ncbi:MAG: hypothetical protein AAFY17_18230, partial [Cyanobacteria bacterium J06642_11]
APNSLRLGRVHPAAPAPNQPQSPQLDELDQALENLALEEEIGDAVAESDIDPDLMFLEDEEDEDITLIQANSLDLDQDLMLLEEGIDLDDGEIALDDEADLLQIDDLEDEDVTTVIQADSLELHSSPGTAHQRPNFRLQAIYLRSRQKPRSQPPMVPLPSLPPENQLG